MPQKKWQTILPPSTAKDALPAVRRFGVPGGFLYQVENHTETDNGDVVWVEWFAPVFVPFHGDGHE